MKLNHGEATIISFKGENSLAINILFNCLTVHRESIEKRVNAEVYSCEKIESKNGMGEKKKDEHKRRTRVSFI